MVAHNKTIAHPDRNVAHIDKLCYSPHNPVLQQSRQKERLDKGPRLTVTLPLNSSHRVEQSQEVWWSKEESLQNYFTERGEIGFTRDDSFKELVEIMCNRSSHYHTAWEVSG